jgi:hypothetical protein
MYEGAWHPPCAFAAIQSPVANLVAHRASREMGARFRCPDQRRGRKIIALTCPAFQHAVRRDAGSRHPNNGCTNEKARHRAGRDRKYIFLKQQVDLTGRWRGRRSTIEHRRATIHTAERLNGYVSSTPVPTLVPGIN